MRIPKPRSLLGHDMTRCVWWCLAFLAVGAPGVFANDCQLKLHNKEIVTELHWELYLDLESEGWPRLDDSADAGYVYYTFSEVQNVRSVSIEESEYFEVTYDGGSEVIIKTKEKFPVYKKDENSIEDVTLKLQFTCAGGPRELRVIFSVDDNNKYPPQMTSNVYKYTPTMPLPSGYILTSILPIEGKDYDFTTTNIRANISSDLFSAVTVPSASGKWRAGFQVILTATKEIRIKDKEEIKLTIKDEGTKRDKTIRTTDLLVVIDPDLTNTIFSPRFKNPLYAADVQDLTSEEISGNLPLINLIDFEEGYAHDLEYTLEDGGSHNGGNANDFIKFEKDEESNGVRLLWKEDLDPAQLETFLKKAFALLILTAKIPDSPLTPSGRTVIHVALPGSKIDLTPTTTPEPCPTTETPTECPICTTPEPCPTTETPTQCPIYTTPEPCPTTQTPTECPICTTPEPCPTTQTPTECPICMTHEPCPTTETPTECPICITPAPDPNPSTPNPLPTVTDCPLTCPPVTECPSEGTTNSECPTCPTECSAIPTTECPLTCPSVTEHPSEGTTNCECPTCPTECSAVPTTECPLTCPSVTEHPSEGTTNSQCPTCPTECSAVPTTECPLTCPSVTDYPSQGTTNSQCPTCPTECPAVSATTECPITCPPVTECPSEGPSTCGPSVATEPAVTPDPGTELEFQQSSYFKTIAANEETGSTIEVIKLKENVEGVEYSLETESGSTPIDALDIDRSGVVTLVFPPPLGTHSYYVHAVVPEVGKGKTQLWLHVSNVPDGNHTFPYALEVRKVPEKKKMQVWPESGNSEKCISITGGEKYFTLENNIVYSRTTTDRESEEFGGAEAPVVTLQIRSSCAEGERFRSNYSLRATWDEAVGNIVYDPNYTTVAVIIEDENDNAPRFDASQMVIGYPERELAAALRLPSLLVAEAKDRDIGDNAKLRYSLDQRGAEQFEVHPLTGAVYPRHDVTAVSDEFQFTVRATDRDGSPGDAGTLTGNLDVTVRALHPEHLLEVRVRGALLEDVDDLLALASDSGASQRRLHALSAMVLSGDGDATEGDGSGAEDTDINSYLRIVVYSIADGMPEKADEFEGDVQKTLSDGGWPPETAAPDLGKETIWSKSNNSGLLAAVITLGVLLGLMLIGTGLAGYWFAIRPRMRGGALPPQYEHKSASLSDSVVGIEPISDDFLQKRQLENELRDESSPDLDIPTDIDIPRPMIIFNDERPRAADVMLDDAVSEAGTLDTINTYDTILTPEQRALPKKSVVFNEDVDCIEIRL